MVRVLSVAIGVGVLVACGGGTDLDCAVLDESGCGLEADCQSLFGGQVVDAACDSNQAAPSFQGCIDAETTCDDVITVGTAPNGTQYRFDNSCVPDDFTSEPCL